uniref:Tumor necrosis factor receptor superfamily member 19L n=1 Tax=Xenopus tropicalis TaxID=8364 RepID=G1K3E2_XENTR
MCGAPYWLSLTFANFVFLCFQLLIWGGTCQTEEPEKLECGKAEYTSENGNCTPCVLCPPGKEPDRACGFGRGEGVSCQSCAPGTFSNRLGMSFCTPLTQCDKRKRMLLSAGTPKADAVCGGCLSGVHLPFRRKLLAKTSQNDWGATVCSLGPFVSLPALNHPCLSEENGNEDTIGVLVRLISEKKGKALTPIPAIPSRLLLLPQMPHLCKHQHHLHTVQGPALPTGSCCSRCSQKKWTNAAGKVGRQGEITILAVGRFRVARIPEQKPSSLEVKAPCDPRIPEPPCETQPIGGRSCAASHRRTPGEAHRLPHRCRSPREAELDACFVRISEPFRTRAHY